MVLCVGTCLCVHAATSLVKYFLTNTAVQVCLQTPETTIIDRVQLHPDEDDLYEGRTQDLVKVAAWARQFLLKIGDLALRMEKVPSATAAPQVRTRRDCVKPAEREESSNA